MLGTDELYKLLYRHMGPQNWWPADNDIELMLGAILVQNQMAKCRNCIESD